MLPVYKVHLLRWNNTISDIYVFSNLEKAASQQLTEEIRLDPQSAGVFFDAEELAYIQEKEVNVEVVPQLIYGDDTVDVVKRKFMQFDDSRIPFEALYLFGKVKQTLNPLSVYETLTQKGRVELTHLRLLQFLSNISYQNVESLPVKESYTYDDILELGLGEREWNVSVPIGQHFVAVEGTYPYSVNPNNLIEFDKLLAGGVGNMVSTSNSQLLFDTGKLVDNAIFLCTLPNVVEFLNKNNLAEETGIRIYFPFLATMNILSLDQYNEQLSGLLKENKSRLLTPAFTKHEKSVNLLNSIYQERNTNKYSVVYEGVNSIEFTLHPVYSFRLPLDIVFKLLHTDSVMPFIKYNPGKGQEKMYRLYANRAAVDGRRIPYLAKNSLFKYARNVGKRQSVSGVIEPEGSNNVYYCEFTSNGDVTITALFDQILSLEVIQTAIAEHVNPAIRVISSFLAQSGYSFDEFTSLGSPNVEILSLDYKLGFPAKKPLNLDKRLGCLSAVFNLNQEPTQKEIKLQYKRVSNFSEMESIEAFMLTQMRRGIEEEELLLRVVENFNLDENAARERLADLLNQIQNVQNAFQNKRFKIKNNPGFPVQITKNVNSGTYDVTVSDVTDADYIPFIRAFVDSMLRISQDVGSTSLSATQITNGCKSKPTEPKADIVVVEDIVAAPERPVSTQAGIDIVAEEVEIVDDKDRDEYLNFLLGDDEEEEEDEEDDGGASGNQSGGAESDSRDSDKSSDAENGSQEIQRDVTGLNLGHPNPFFIRMKEKDPALFLTRKEGKFNAYSKICPSYMRRQPVILTDAEKQRIDKDHPGSYNKAIKYGTSADKSFWYICPRYWSLSRNTSLTEEEVKSGKYGRVIPKDASTVPAGADIYEFGHYDSEGNYEQFYPGFIESTSHPSGYCLPCCFKSWDAPKQKRLREQCQTPSGRKEEIKQKDTKDVTGAKQAQAISQAERKPQVQEPAADSLPGEPSLEGVQLSEKQVTGVGRSKSKGKKTVARVEADNYILGSDKFPLDIGRWGFLVPVLQMFFDYDSKKCALSPANPTLKQDTPCLLRHGVQPSEKQSFIAAIADAFAEYNQNKVLSIVAMKERILDAVTLSNFSIFQNGNLIDLFYNEERPIDTSVYENDSVPLYQELSGKPNGMVLFRKIVNAYENFRDFLRDDNVLIDYRYLWDVITIPNASLFPKGLNLVILEVPEDDVTGNVEMICPTNQYSKDPFDFNRSSLILYKAGNYYEPLYVVKDTGKTVALTRFFSLKSSALLAPIKSLLTLIKSATNEMCVPLASMPTVYSFRSNIPATETYRLLNLKDFTIHSQVVNYSGQTIALIGSTKTGKSRPGYIPTTASAPLPSIPKQLIDEVNVYGNYKDTLDFLTEVVGITKGKVPVRPKLRVEEDGVTVGILTETNQLVLLSTPELVTSNELPAVDETMTAAAEMDSEIGTNIDEERVAFVNKIRLETEFYNTFRNTVRILLSQQSNWKKRQDLQTVIQTPYLTYLEKLQEVAVKLRELAEGHIQWISGFDYDLLSRNDELKPTSCVLFKKDRCGMMPLCAESTNSESCLTTIPKTNLITGGDSETSYYYKMADELVRYNRIRAFIFSPTTFLSLGKIGYDLHPDEIILLQSMLTPEYIDGLEEVVVNRYVSNNTFQTTQPISSVPYASNFIIDQKDKTREEIEDEHGQVTNVVMYGKWKSFFPQGSSEIKFVPSSPQQTFEPIRRALKQYASELGDLSLQEVKEILVSQYESKITSLIQIKAIWTNERKKAFVQLLNEGRTLESLVMSESYYVSPIDTILLAQFAKVPLILFSSTKLASNDKPFLKTQASGEYLYMKVPSLEYSDLPSYRFVVSKSGIMIPTATLPPSSQADIEKLEVFDVSDYKKPSVVKLKKTGKVVLKVLKKPSAMSAQSAAESKKGEAKEEEPKKKVVLKRRRPLKIVANAEAQ